MKIDRLALSGSLQAPPPRGGRGWPWLLLFLVLLLALGGVAALALRIFGFWPMLLMASGAVLIFTARELEGQALSGPLVLVGVLIGLAGVWLGGHAS